MLLCLEESGIAFHLKVQASGAHLLDEFERSAIVG
jgi:hypothetical protein